MPESSINYDGPEESVKCAYPGCTNRLRRAAFTDEPQFCSREHRDEPQFYQAIIKVNPTDTPERQASDIADGIGYACALLLDEHCWSAERVADLLERVTDEVADSEAQRG